MLASSAGYAVTLPREGRLKNADRRLLERHVEAMQE